MPIDACIELLNNLNGDGKIEYCDYSRLHDLISGINTDPWVKIEPGKPETFPKNGQRVYVTDGCYVLITVYPEPALDSNVSMRYITHWMDATIPKPPKEG